jgi:hypothetical protein
MEELKELWVHGAAFAAAVSTIVARYRATDSSKSFWDRVAITFDFTQIFDSTRKIND